MVDPVGALGGMNVYANGGGNPRALAVSVTGNALCLL